MIKVLSGTNDFLRRQKLQEYIGAFKERYGDFGLEQIDARDVEFGRLLESVASLPFLAEKRLIILNGVGDNKVLSEKVDELLGAVSDSTELLIDEAKFDKRSKLYKTLKKKTDFQEYTELDEQGLVAWLCDEAKRRGGSLTKADALMIVRRAGANQMGLSQELDKLLSYDPLVTKQTIEMLVEPMPNSTVFELIEAAFNGNHKKAMELYQDQRKQQVEPQAIMGMITWQVHTMAVVKFSEKEHPSTIASNAKINPFVVRKTLSLVSKKTQKELRDLVSRTLDLDVRLKSESIDADGAVQHYLLTL